MAIIPYISVGPRNRTTSKSVSMMLNNLTSETNLDVVIVQPNESKLESATDLEEFFVKAQRKLDFLQEKS